MVCLILQEFYLVIITLVNVLLFFFLFCFFERTFSILVVLLFMIEQFTLYLLKNQSHQFY